MSEQSKVPIKIRKNPQKYLGPSQVPAVLGYDSFMNADELRDRIENGHVKIYTSAQRCGIRKESGVIQQYQNQTSDQVQKAHFIVDTNDCPRLGGIGDALVGTEGGLEVKCSGRSDVFMKYKIQAVCYMYLYHRRWWDIAVHNTGTEQTEYTRLYWVDFRDTWYNYWYPKIIEFCNETSWKKELR